MNPDFKWKTRDEKREVVRFWWREQRGICWICEDRENPMEPYSQAAISPWAATVEHLIPKRENGPDTVGNVRLAHRWCNNVLGALWEINRTRRVRGLEPLTAKWALSNARGTLYPEFKTPKVAQPLRRVQSVPIPETTVKGEKLIRGTLAWAIAQGEVTEHHTYVKPKPQPEVKKKRKPRPIKPIDLEALVLATRKTLEGWEAARRKFALPKSQATDAPL